jgi:hypothetical protein
VQPSGESNPLFLRQCSNRFLDGFHGHTYRIAAYLDRGQGPKRTVQRLPPFERPPASPLETGLGPRHVSGLGPLRRPGFAAGCHRHGGLGRSQPPAAVRDSHYAAVAGG